jgi:hypothetical protein
MRSARSKATLAARSGIERTTLYRAFAPAGYPELLTVLKVLGALGLRLGCYCGNGDVSGQKVRSIARPNPEWKSRHQPC